MYTGRVCVCDDADQIGGQRRGYAVGYGTENYYKGHGPVLIIGSFGQRPKAIRRAGPAGCLSVGRHVAFFEVIREKRIGIRHTVRETFLKSGFQHGPTPWPFVLDGRSVVVVVCETDTTTPVIAAFCLGRGEGTAVNRG